MAYIWIIDMTNFWGQIVGIPICLDPWSDLPWHLRIPVKVGKVVGIPDVVGFEGSCFARHLARPDRIRITFGTWTGDGRDHQRSPILMGTLW
jgi:hypothetical protein